MGIKKKGQMSPREAAGFEESSSMGGAPPRDGAWGSGLSVDAVMKPPKCCREADTVRSCARTMQEENIGFAPVCNAADAPIGTITDRDLTVRVLAKGLSAETPIRDVMTRDVVSCTIGADLREAEHLMREHRKSRIMVCDEDGRLAGVISLSDIAELEDDTTAVQTVRDVSSRESRQPHAS